MLSKVSPEIIPQRRIILKARRDGACLLPEVGLLSVVLKSFNLPLF